MNLSFSKRFTTMKSQLKYFYLINIEQIIDSILNDLNGKDDNSTYFLETVFKHVFKGLNQYGNFLFLNSYNSFFNEFSFKFQIRGTCQLIYLALQNNCILNGFFHEIASKSSKIEITAKMNQRLNILL